MSNEKELRKLGIPEFRSDGDDLVVTGYAATFGDITRIGNIL